MSKIKFTPQLIQRDDVAIKEQIEKLEKAAELLSDLSDLWGKQFNERLAYHTYGSTRTHSDTVCLLDLKYHYVALDAKLSEDYQPGRKNLDIAIRDGHIDFPEKELKGLAEILIYTKREVSKNLYMNPSWIADLFANDLEVPSIIKNAVATANSHYTKNIRQNFVLELCRNFAETANLINNMGGFVSAKNIPAAIAGCFTVQKTDKKYSDFTHRHGEAHYFIEQLVPGHTLKESNIAIYDLLRNFTDEQIFEMYANLKNKK